MPDSNRSMAFNCLGVCGTTMCFSELSRANGRLFLRSSECLPLDDLWRSRRRSRLYFRRIIEMLEAADAKVQSFQTPFDGAKILIYRATFCAGRASKFL